MSSDEECPPPLEDMTDFVEKIQRKKDKVKNNTAKVTYQKVAVDEKPKVAEITQPKSQSVVPKNNTTVEKGYGGMRKGFLFGKLVKYFRFDSELCIDTAS